MQELKPCPFCGSKQIDNDVAVQYDESDLSVARYFYSCVCGACGCRTTLFNQKQNAVDAWNRRTAHG